jgi:hypothetical protein
MIVYAGSLDDRHEFVQFLRRETAKLRALRKLIITRQGTTLRDVNKDGIEFPGLTFGSPILEVLLEELGVVFSPQTLHNPAATLSGVKEFDLSARYTWGNDRVM